MRRREVLLRRIPKDPLFWIACLSGSAALACLDPWVGISLVLAWTFRHRPKRSGFIQRWGVVLLGLLLPWIDSPMARAEFSRWMAVLLCLSAQGFLSQRIGRQTVHSAVMGLSTAWVWALSSTLFVVNPCHIAVSLALFLACVLVEDPPGSFWRSALRTALAGVFASLLLSESGQDFGAVWAWTSLTLFLLLLLERVLASVRLGFLAAPVLFAAVGGVSAWTVAPLLSTSSLRLEVEGDFFAFAVAGGCLVWGEARRALRALGPRALGSILPFCLWLGVALLVSPGLSYLAMKDVLFLSVLGLGTFLATLVPDRGYVLARQGPPLHAQ